jgi:hypothetical protein
MIHAPLEIVEGWTGALPFTLKADGLGLDILGLRIQAVLEDANGVTVFDSSGKLTLTNGEIGELVLNPSSSDFYVSGSPFRLRFRLTDVGNRVPSGEHAPLIRVFSR